VSRRRGTSSIAANPVLIGAATTLVIIVAVFLAYNANSGLPFVPSYQLTATVPDANNLVKGNDVRIGGARVGILSEITPIQRDDGTVGALLKMKLQTSEKPLPVDSAILIRSRSALGLKYIEITRGRSDEGFKDGATIPLANAHPEPVEIDQVFNIFDKPTRDASQTNLLEFGNALAGRGQNLNQAIAAFNPLLLNLVPVMTNLSDPKTRLNRFFLELGNAARIVAPAAESQAELFRNLDTTFTAISGVLGPLQESISGGPAALDAAIKSFPIQRPFLANSAAFFRELRPGIHSLKTSAPILADAFETGTKTLPKAVPLNKQLQEFFPALERLATDPLVPLAIKDLTRTVNILDPTLNTLTPAQTVCNYGTIFFRNVASLFSEGDKNGTWQRFMIVAPPQGPNNEGGPASAPANGPNPDNYLHSNPYPNAAGAGQTNECEAGNEGYIKGRQVIGNVPGNQGLTTEGQTSKNGKASGN
jgi:virulence factor Mce-like protein